MIPLRSVCHSKFQCIVSHLECSLSLTEAIWFLALLSLIILALQPSEPSPFGKPLLFCAYLCFIQYLVSPLPQREKPSHCFSANSTFFFFFCHFCSLRKEICKWSRWLYFSLSVVPIPLHPVQEWHYEWTPDVKSYFKSYSADSTADSVLFIILTVSHPASSGWPTFGPTALFFHLNLLLFFFCPPPPSCLSFLSDSCSGENTLHHHSYTGLSFICNHTSSASLQVPQIDEGFS